MNTDLPKYWQSVSATHRFKEKGAYIVHTVTGLSNWIPLLESRQQQRNSPAWVVSFPSRALLSDHFLKSSFEPATWAARCFLEKPLWPSPLPAYTLTPCQVPGWGPCQAPSTLSSPLASHIYLELVYIVRGQNTQCPVLEDMPPS